MTRLEAALLFVAVFELGALLGLAWWLRRRRRPRPLYNVGEQVTWAMNYIRDRYGSASPPLTITEWPAGGTDEIMRRGVAAGLGVHLGPPPVPHLEEGTEVELVRRLEGGWQDRRRYRVERAIGEQVRLSRIPEPAPLPDGD